MAPISMPSSSEEVATIAGNFPLSVGVPVGVSDARSRSNGGLRWHRRNKRNSRIVSDGGWARRPRPADPSCGRAVAARLGGMTARAVDGAALLVLRHDGGLSLSCSWCRWPVWSVPAAPVPDRPVPGRIRRRHSRRAGRFRPQPRPRGPRPRRRRNRRHRAGRACPAGRCQPGSWPGR